MKAVEIRFLDPASRQWGTEWPAAGSDRGRVSAGDRRHCCWRARSPSSSPWCSRTGVACSACSRSPRETRASTRNRAARGHRDVRDRHHGGRGDHLQQGDGGAARGRHLHARAGIAGRHGRRGAGAASRSRAMAATPRPRPTGHGRSHSARSRSKARASGSRRSSKTLTARFNLNSVVQVGGRADQHFDDGPGPGRSVPAICCGSSTSISRYADLLVDWIDTDIAPQSTRRRGHVVPVADPALPPAQHLHHARV